MVTGASGFLGIHVVQRLLHDGHEVRALVRSPDRLRDNLALLDIALDDALVQTVTGGMTDPDAVRAAVAGCELAVHAAATYSYRRRDADRITQENLSGTAAVLTAATDAGCTGIVHVSSIAALLRPGAVLDADSPLGQTLGPYTGSKVESDRFARERQAAGAPVTVVCPGAIVGPNDPNLGESNELVRDVLRGRVPVYPRGALQLVDVRDTATVVVAALQRPGRRFMVPGETVTVPHVRLSQLTGRRLPVVTVPLAVALPALRLGYRTDWPFLPHAVEGSRLVGSGTTVDFSRTEHELGFTGRALDETLGDTVRWLAATGHISLAQAGRCLDPRPPGSGRADTAA